MMIFNGVERCFVTLRMIAPPVECPMQKQGSPGFSVKTFSRNDFCKDDDSVSLFQEQDVLETIENERDTKSSTA